MEVPMFSTKFICATKDYTTYTHHVPAPYFRKSFVLEDTFFDNTSEKASCSITLCGLGFYDLYINGTRITKGILAPYISNPDDILYYDTYDLTPYVHPGKNILGFHLGNGFMNAPGGQIWDFDKASFRGAPRLAFTLQIQNADGAIINMEADETVKTSPSPVLFDDERCGCFYDARKEIPLWADPSFDDSNWANALYAETPKGEPRLCEAEPIICSEVLSPLTIRPCTLADYHPRGDVVREADPLPLKVKDGYLYDFGKNISGTVQLTIRGQKGQQVDLQFCEYIDPEGHPDYSNINFFPEGYAQRDIYILKGDGVEIFEPVFTYHGFRYCIVLGLTEEQATKDLLKAKSCHSDLKERGTFSCSDEIFNQLQEMTRRSDLANFFYFPTDCPHREKNGWTGDAAASCEHMLLNLTAETSLKEWCRNLVKAQNKEGALPGIVPTGGWGFAWGNGPAWDAALTYLPYYVYQYTGDKTILEENADAILKYAFYILSRADEKGLIHVGLGDWLPITTIRSPLEVTDSITVLSILYKAAFIFRELHRYDLEHILLIYHGKLREAIRDNLIDEDTLTVEGHCQTSQALALYHHVFDPEEEEEAFQVLMDIIHEDGDKLDCGFLGMRYLFRVLADHGEADLACSLIRGPEYPSYGNFVRRGLTTLPEDFAPEDSFPKSLNHHFFGDVSAFFIEYLAGLRPNPFLRDPSEIMVAPLFVKSLSFAEASYKNENGSISVRWGRSHEKKIELHIEITGNFHGAIRLPKGYMVSGEEVTSLPLTSGDILLTRTN